jgi:hypothetical protein
MTTKAISIRLLREAEPPSSGGSPVRFGLQDRKGVMHEGVRRADGVVRFDLDLTVTGTPGLGHPDFGGPFVSGPPGERFVYLAWQRLDGAGFMNRIKVRLADIDWDLIHASQGKSLEADLRGMPAGGGRRPVVWLVVKI